MSAPRSYRLLQAAVLGAACLGVSSPCLPQQRLLQPAELIEIPVRPLPFVLQGFLRRPEAAGRHPAVVLLPFCGEFARAADEDWGAKISSWGYVTLTVNSTVPRGIDHCSKAVADYADLAYDVYRGLNLLAQKAFVDRRRMAVVGFGWGAWQTLAAIERGEIEQSSELKFRAAAAFYPLCGSFKGRLTVPTLLLAGEGDLLAPANACRKLVAGEDDMGISRHKGESAPIRLIVYPRANLVPRKTSAPYRGIYKEFDQSAAEQSAEALRDFLDQHLGTSGKT